MKFIKLVCNNPLIDCEYELFVETKQPIYDINCPACEHNGTIHQRKTKYEKGESRTGARLQEDAGAFFIRFCAINPISGSKKNGFFQSGGHGASIPRRRHRRDSVHLGRH